MAAVSWRAPARAAPGALLAGAALIALSGLAAAAAPARDGTLVGFDCGYGRGRLGYENLLGGIRLPDEAQDGFTLDLRVGHAMRPDLVLCLHLGGWFGTIRSGDAADSWQPAAEDDWALSAIGGSVSWFPGAGPLFVRAGCGRALGSVTLADVGGFQQIHRDAGLAARLGMGWELPLGSNFAVCPTLEWQALDFGSGDQASVASFTLGVTAY